jgi:hypothetical protein
MFEWDFNVRVSLGLPSFSRLVDTIHDYVWEPDDDDE